MICEGDLVFGIDGTFFTHSSEPTTRTTQNTQQTSYLQHSTLYNLNDTIEEAGNVITRS